MVAAAVGLAVVPVRAQTYVTRADALVSAGRIFAAESLYYAAVRRAPRDPRARLALGKYLAARGAWRVGAVLMEEARFFGGDAQVVATELAPVYLRLGDFGALASLRSSRLSYAERSRAEWLRDNPPSVSGPDSVKVSYQALDSRTFGRVTVHIGGDSVSALIDPRAQGLTLDTAWARLESVRTFRSKSVKNLQQAAGVALAARLGVLALQNVPIRFAPQKSRRSATIGLDLIGAFAPTFDPKKGTVMLRKSGVVAGYTPGFRYATLTLGVEPRLVSDNSLIPLNHAHAVQLLRNRPWTLNPRRGELIVHDR